MTRRGSIAEQLAAVRKFITEPDHEPEPIQTNWEVTPANDNNPEDLAGMKVERSWDISPSPEEIIRQTSKDDIEYGYHIDDSGKRHKITIRWGSLRFSDGTQTEQGFKLSIDGDALPAQIRIPVGGLLNSTDKERAQRGGGENPQELIDTNRYFGAKGTEDQQAGLFNAVFSRPVKRVARKERTGPKTKTEARQWLADAIANTAVMPEVKKCPGGFPAGPANLAQLFPGLVKNQTAGSGSMAWQDIVSEREARNEFFKWVDGLDGKDRKVLEAVKTAKTYADVGKAIGQSPEYARRKGGRKVLISANDNLMRAINLVA